LILTENFLTKIKMSLGKVMKDITAHIEKFIKTHGGSKLDEFFEKHQDTDVETIIVEYTKLLLKSLQKEENDETDFVKIVNLMKIQDQLDTQEKLRKINNVKTLTEKCILARQFLPPTSTSFEHIIRMDLGIDKKVDEVSGDGVKNDKNFEIKASLHAKKSKVNFVQIRPDHNIDFYLLVTYNMYENDTIGQAHIYNVPSDDMYKLISEHGSYAHGTMLKNGKIMIENMKGRNFEYCLRYDPNSKSVKNQAIIKYLQQFKVTYDPKHF